MESIHAGYIKRRGAHGAPLRAFISFTVENLPHRP